jgi:hypothetical protein
MTNWIAETAAHTFDPGTAIHFSSASLGTLRVGDTVTVNGPGFPASDGRITSLDDRQLIVELSTGTRFAFRTLRDGDKASGITTPSGQDWVLLLVSPGELRT